MNTQPHKGHRKIIDQSPNIQVSSKMDIKAKRSQLHDTIMYDQPYKGRGAMLIINNKWITMKYEEQIQHTIMELMHKAFSFEKYLTKSSSHINLINLEGIDWTRASFTINQNTQLIKKNSKDGSI